MRNCVITLAIALSMTCCKEEKKTISSSDLVGVWDVSKAYRDGRETKTMASAYFKFNENYTVESNVHQVSEEKKFKVSGNKLEVSGQENYNLEIVRLQNDTMHLKGKMWFFDMDFFLIRNKMVM